MDVHFVIFLSIISVICTLSAGEYDPFADNILFSIKWPGPMTSPAPTETESMNLHTASSDGDVEGETMYMTTKNNERYKCIIPVVTREDKKSDIDSYTGPNEMELLKPMFDQSSCSYRIETYWTYELCHGRFLRQYHEEKEPGKKPTLQEYFLGKYQQPDQKDSSEVKTEKDKEEKPVSDKIPLQKVEGLEIPYFAVKFVDGTKCDLTNGARSTQIHYVCQPDGKGEIYSLKEVSTCEYEVVVLTRYLCSHPAYKTKKESVNAIQCHALDESPVRPRNLDNMELENTLGRYNKAQENDDEEETKPSKVKDIPPRPNTPISENADKQLLAQFLSGDYCIQGGAGWWKHEFCYGKYVNQFHEEKNSKTVIMLGHWDEVRHKAWLSMNTNKKPKPIGQRKKDSILTHFYGYGDKCDLTGRNRFVEVRLKCKESPNQPHAVAIYLVEQNPCEYTLVVESPILCQLIQQADEFGIINQV